MPHESLQNVAEKWCDLTWPTVAEAEAGPIRSRELGRQLAVRLLTTSHPPPTPRQHAHTLSLIAKRGQRDFKPPQASPHPPRIGPTKYIQKKRKTKKKIVETRISIVDFGHFMWQLFHLFFFFFSLVWPAWVSLCLSVYPSVCLAFWPPRQLCSASVARPFCSDY